MKKIFFTALAVLLVLIQTTAFCQHSSSFTVKVAGSGKQTAILIPGFTCSGDVWNATVQELAKTYTCHTITFAGFAGVPAQDDPHLQNWVAAIAAYIQKEHLDKPVIIGHSIGGGMAMWLAADYPQLVSKIVVVDALPCLAAVQNPAFVSQKTVDASAYIQRYSSMSDSALLAAQKQTIPMMCADTSMQPTIVQWSMKSDRKTMGQLFAEFYNTDLRDTIARIQCPALILLEPYFATNDAMMQKQYSGLTDKTIRYATKGLHFIMYDDKDWYLQQIGQYLL